LSPFHLLFCFSCQTFLCLHNFFDPCLILHFLRVLCLSIITSAPCRKLSVSVRTWASGVLCGQVAGRLLSSFCSSHIVGEKGLNKILKFCNVFGTKTAVKLVSDGKVYAILENEKVSQDR
jgi:hypothetical protein